MLTVKMRNDEVKGRRDEERFFADIERILKADQVLTRHLNRENIDRPELWVVHIPNENLAGAAKHTPRLNAPVTKPNARIPGFGHWSLIGAGCFERNPSA
jgi:hypothetical protein